MGSCTTPSPNSSSMSAIKSWSSENNSRLSPLNSHRKAYNSRRNCPSRWKPSGKKYFFSNMPITATKASSEEQEPQLSTHLPHQTSLSRKEKKGTVTLRLSERMCKSWRTAIKRMRREQKWATFKKRSCSSRKSCRQRRKGVVIQVGNAS